MYFANFIAERRPAIKHVLMYSVKCYRLYFICKVHSGILFAMCGNVAKWIVHQTVLMHVGKATSSECSPTHKKAGVCAVMADWCT